MEKLTITGCRVTPLAQYLKALGLARILSSEYDSVRFWWSDDFLRISVPAAKKEISDFLLTSYSPSPIMAPWNGGSGFYSSDNQTAINSIKASESERLTEYRASIMAAEDAVSQLGLTAKPDSVTKEELLRLCRNTFPDFGLAWLDAVMVMTSGGPKYPPLLGTGGNDGRLEFTNNFMQRVTEVFGLGTKKQAEMSPIWLENALFGTAVPGFVKSPIGQFDPGNAGGANASTGFDSDSLINPWDFILMMEGALLFAGAAVKRLNSQSGDSLAYPFCVKQTSAGYSTSAKSDEDSKENHSEMWMPLWSRPASLREIEHLFSEGRVEINGLPARNATEFSRSLVSLGVDRGLTEFQRFGFLKRFGKAFFAVPLDRIRVERKTEATLLDDIDRDKWFHDFRKQTSNEKLHPPSNLVGGLRRIEKGIIRFCKSPISANAATLLVALGETEKSLGKSFKWARENRVKPLSHLSPRWLSLANDGSAEFRLAASLASMVSRFGREWFTLRAHLEPVQSSKFSVFWKKDQDRNVVWSEGNLVDVMNRIFQRRLLMEGRAGEEKTIHFAKIAARLEDVSAFIEERTDDARIADLLWAMILLDFTKERPSSDEDPYWIEAKRSEGQISISPPSIYALLRSCFCRTNPKPDTGREEMDRIPVSTIIHRRAADGQGTEASRLAARRLRASGLRPAVSEIVFGDTKRIAAAMLFPLRRKDEKRLLKWIQRPDRETADSESETSEPSEELIEAD